ncbi:MAG: AAA family ATPase [Treponema sp.]|nr:AAA family ATPase [Treponema sp.]
MIKVVHIADLHCCKEHQEEALKSLHFLAQSIKKSPVDLVAIAGDTWDASMLNTEASGFNGFVDAIRDIADEAPVAMIYGTPSHDTDGSLEVFRKINCGHSITVLEPAQSYLLLNEGVVLDDGKAHPEANATAGKDETEALLRSSMQKLCFILAAKRRDHAELPCVMLYHGDVAGCSLQNDRTIERGTGISISIDDLSQIGADYYALGHIHKPQQVGTLPAYYAGSIYPKDFGETHKAGFNLVQIEGAKIAASVERVEFPHSQNMKIESGAECKINGEEIKGKRVWLEITCTKEERVMMNEDTILADLLAHGAVEGSRVTISDIPVETVRAAEITEAAGVSEKYKVWAENSGIELKDSVLKKIAELDTEISKDSAKAHGAWELVSLKLRGSTGIKKGIGKDEISIDFDSYDSGLIALTGENGKGKTTLIENCHPYPQLLTRKGKLQDHFCLRDSFREVIYRDRESKRMVKCLIQIDGETKSGSCNYYAYTSNDGGANWEAVPGVDKNSAPYEDFVLATFGPMELFLRTAFITQRPTKNLPDLTDATAGEKKTLFVELAGIDYLQKFADAANDRAKIANLTAHDAEIRAQTLELTVSRRADVENAMKEAEKQLSEKNAELEKVTADGKKAREELNTAQERANKERDRAYRESEARADAEKVKGEIASIESEIFKNENAANGKEANEALVKKYEAFQETVSEEQKKQNVLNEENSKRMADYLSQKSAYDDKVRKIEKGRDELADKKASVEREIANARNDIKLHERDAAEFNDTCPTCGQKLPADKITELTERRDNAKRAIKLIENGIAEKENSLSELNREITSLTQEISEIAFEEPMKPQTKVFDASVLNNAVQEMSKIDINRVRTELETAKTALVRIEGLNAQIADKKKLLSQAESVVEKLASEKDLEAGNALIDAQVKHESLSAQYTRVKSEIASLETTIESAKENLSEIDGQKTQLDEAEKQAGEAKAESTEWELVAKAFGKDGIQALELDALAPGISDTANNLLHSAYGDRFTISIETTRIGGAGKKTKQIEDFKIMVTDDGETTTLENKSGGEAVWIKRAIYDAFAVIRRRNTGFAFLTCFQDETDGALDASAKTAYCRMLEASHEAAKLRHTIIITHSNEVKAMVEQKIAMEGL